MPRSRPRATETEATRLTAAMMRICDSADSEMPKSRARPLLICMVPSPIETATPKRVPTMARMSMSRPTGPWMRSPSSGWNMELTRGGRLRLYMK
jgi:hypothetical protein